MTDYPYEGQLIADPVTFQRATNAQISVYDAADTANGTLLALKDATGLPLTNPLTSSADAFTRPFYAPSQDIKLVGAGLTVFVSSAKGMRDAAAAAASAAQTAASSASTAAGNTVASASVDASGNLVIQKASGAQVNAGPVKGPKGDKGDTGAKGADGSNVLPTDDAIEAAILGTGTKTKAALSATYATPASVTAQTANKALIADQAQLADQAVGIARVAQAFARPAGGISISREGSDYWLWHGLGGGLFSRYQLKNYTANAGNLPLRQLAGLDAVQAMFDTDDPAATFVGTWTPGTNALSVGGAYKYSTTAGDTATWSSPAGATSVGVTVVEITNGGMLMKVEVDGATANADRLLTVQEVIDKGWYANTILTANGGTLAPTDRVMDSYSPTTAANNYAARRVLASGLTPGVHTVKVTNTGYLRGALTAQRAYLTGFLHAFPGTLMTDSGAQAVTDTILSGIASAWEYAYYGQPAGTTAPGEMGNIHGWEAEVSLTIKVDDVTSTPADLTRVDATKQIVVTRVTQLRHTQLGTTAVADVVTQYILDRRGLRVDVQTTWNRDFTPTWMWLMLPVNGATTNAPGMRFNRGNMMDYPGGAITFTGASGDLYVGRSKSVAAWLWSTTGKFAVMAAVPDHTTFLNRWQNSVTQAYAQLNDRSGNIAKIYFPRAMAGGDVIPAGTVLTSSVRYKVGYFPAGSEASLASL